MRPLGLRISRAPSSSSLRSCLALRFSSGDALRVARLGHVLAEPGQQQAIVAQVTLHQAAQPLDGLGGISAGCSLAGAQPASL